MEIKEIQNLIKFVAKSGVAEVKIKDGDFAIQIKNIPEQVITHSTYTGMPQGQMQQSQMQQVAEPAVQSEAKQESAEPVNDKLVEIKSPMIGTFYRRPSPDKDLFVKVGDSIKVGDTVCIIEAMKLFNEIESEVSGKIVKILVDDSTPVEYDQPLFLVDPS
ncbi:MAG: acetyl-CoA carboxylase biotin carboxyl carrier protein [Weeksellaceae bacterium]